MSKQIFKPGFFLLVFLIGGIYSIASSFPQDINLKSFYTAVASDDSSKINAQLKLVEHSKSLAAKAYTGTLLMKKAGYQKTPHSKLKTFKEGRNLLEDAIKIENQNGEFRFLRLIIQENCPGILNYNDEIDEDTAMVKKSYKSFPPELKQAISDYSKVSKILKPGDFVN